MHEATRTPPLVLPAPDALEDRVSLELSYQGVLAAHEAAHRSVAVLLVGGKERHAGAVQRLRDVQEEASVAGEAVVAGDEEHVEVAGAAALKERAQDGSLL
jgi:hypothetical protein